MSISPALTISVSWWTIAADSDVAAPGSIEEARWLTPWAAQLRYEMLEPLDRDAAFSTASDAVAWAAALLAS